MFTPNTKNGQAEILGLVFIVILLLVIGLIYLRFNLQKPSPYPTLRTNIIANNLLKAIMKVQTPSFAIKTLIRQCNTQPATCTQLNDEIDTAFRKFLKPNQPYHVEIKANDIPFFQTGTCTEGITAIYPSVDQGTFYEITLTLC